MGACMRRHTCRSQRSVLWSQFSPPTFTRSQGWNSSGSYHMCLSLLSPLAYRHLAFEAGSLRNVESDDLEAVSTHTCVCIYKCICMHMYVCIYMNIYFVHTQPMVGGCYPHWNRLGFYSLAVGSVPTPDGRARCSCISGGGAQRFLSSWSPCNSLGNRGKR